MAALKNRSVAIIVAAALAAAGGGAALITFNGAEGDAQFAQNDQNTADNPVPEESIDASLDGGDADIIPAGGDNNAVDEFSTDESKIDKGDITLDFSLGAFNDLKDVQLSDLVKKVERVPGVPEETKVWVATADIASAPGIETLYHVKGPLTCGSIGCDLIVIGESGGSRRILLETVGERVDAPEIDTLIINQGTSSESVWVFDGDKFVKT